jgi:hypothetical protein
VEIVSKGLDYFDIEKNLQIAVDDGKVIRIISYAMTSDVENTLDKILERILEKYNRLDLKSLIYTCTKELAINGTKANLKRIFFEEYKLEINNENEYNEGMALYKKVMKEDVSINYGKKAKKKGLYVKISFLYNEDVLKIEVINNSAITIQEELRLREKMAKTMQYDDLMQYYIDNADDTEGEGMGIALIIILLKGENIDPHLFRIYAQDSKTIARIEIPMSKDYKTVRQKNEN